jgi:fumarate reductase iron-sulfur subunit
VTCYLLPIKEPEAIYTIRILRYNPETDDAPHWESYRIPYVKTMTVVEALEYLWDQGEYIAFRTNCREFTCGSCAMLINGKPQLACDTLLQDRMKLEPLSRYAVLRDLVVENDAVALKLKDLEFWPKADDRDKSLNVPEKVMNDFGSIYSRCIECACCLEACPASYGETSKFIGPMYTLLLSRAANHPLDEADRIRQASDCGIWACVSCFECADVCPMNLEPVKEVTKLRRKAVAHSLWRRLTSKQ